MSTSSKSKGSKKPKTTKVAVESVNPVPTNVPSPPEGWVEPALIGRKGRRPKNGLPLAAKELAAELKENASAIRSELGPKAVDPAQLAGALDDANAWDGVEAKASSFHTYARSQRSNSWDAALVLMSGMKLGVRFALQRDATFADRFPGVAKAFAPTRRSKKGTAAKDAAAPAQVEASSPAPSADTKSATPTP